MGVAQAGARAGVPVVQNLAWNVFSVDLSVAVLHKIVNLLFTITKLKILWGS